jgi:hypothetical protein
MHVHVQSCNFHDIHSVCENQGEYLTVPYCASTCPRGTSWPGWLAHAGGGDLIGGGESLTAPTGPGDIGRPSFPPGGGTDPTFIVVSPNFSNELEQTELSLRP